MNHTREMETEETRSEDIVEPPLDETDEEEEEFCTVPGCYRRDKYGTGFCAIHQLYVYYEEWTRNEQMEPREQTTGTQTPQMEPRAQTTGTQTPQMESRERTIETRTLQTERQNQGRLRGRTECDCDCDDKEAKHPPRLMDLTPVLGRLTLAEEHRGDVSTPATLHGRRNYSGHQQREREHAEQRHRRLSLPLWMTDMTPWLQEWQQPPQGTTQLLSITNGENNRCTARKKTYAETLAADNNEDAERKSGCHNRTT